MTNILLQIPIEDLMFYLMAATLVVAVFIIAALLFKKKEGNDTDNKAPTNPIDAQIEERKQTLPLQLQAYERLTLLMERTEIVSLVKRVNPAEMMHKQHQFQLIGLIRQEFEHNITQQLYVSDESWYLIKTAVEGTISDINTVARDMPADATGQELNRALLNYIMGKATASASQNAINQMRIDVGNII